jgi:hypothetical protein
MPTKYWFKQKLLWLPEFLPPIKIWVQAAGNEHTPESGVCGNQQETQDCGFSITSFF